jgi:hypothetical protein
MDAKVTTSKKTLQASLAPLGTNSRGDEQVAREAVDQAKGAADSTMINSFMDAMKARNDTTNGA